MPCNTHVFCIFESHFPSFENAFHTAWPNSFFFFQNIEFLGAVKLFLSSIKKSHSLSTCIGATVKGNLVFCELHTF